MLILVWWCGKYAYGTSAAYWNTMIVLRKSIFGIELRAELADSFSWDTIFTWKNDWRTNRGHLEYHWIFDSYFLEDKNTYENPDVSICQILKQFVNV